MLKAVAKQLKNNFPGSQLYGLCAQNRLASQVGSEDNPRVLQVENNHHQSQPITDRKERTRQKANKTSRRTMRDRGLTFIKRRPIWKGSLGWILGHSVGPDVTSAGPIAVLLGMEDALPATGIDRMSGHQRARAFTETVHDAGAAPAVQRGSPEGPGIGRGRRGGDRCGPVEVTTVRNQTHIRRKPSPRKP